MSVKANEPEFLEALARMEPDLAVTAAYGNFLPSKFLAIPRLGTLNIHPSLLPQFRGAAPVQRALERGVPVTGVTVAYTVLEMDAGPVVRRVERPLDGSEKHVDLLRELFATGAAALLEALPSVWTGEAATLATPQAEFGEPTHAPKVSPEEGVLDFKNETATTAVCCGSTSGAAAYGGLFGSTRAAPCAGRRRPRSSDCRADR